MSSKEIVVLAMKIEDGCVLEELRAENSRFPLCSVRRSSYCSYCWLYCHPFALLSEFGPQVSRRDQACMAWRASHYKLTKLMVDTGIADRFACSTATTSLGRRRAVDWLHGRADEHRERRGAE